MVVAAAGNEGRNNSLANDGYGTITLPGNSPYAITVGAMKTMGTATRAGDLIASYSSKGPTSIDHIAKPDLVAPGNRIGSLLSGNSFLANGYPANKVPGFILSLSYFRESGTSMAAPVVSGAAAILLQKNPSFDPRSGQSDSDEDRIEVVPLQQRCRRTHNRSCLHRLLRHFYGRRRISRHHGRFQLHRYSGRDRAFTQSRLWIRLTESPDQRRELIVTGKRMRPAATSGALWLLCPVSQSGELPDARTAAATHLLRKGCQC